MRALLRAFALFWYDFLIGDDWKIAAYVVVALVGVGALAVLTPVPNTALGLMGTALLMSFFALGVRHDARQASR